MRPTVACLALFAAAALALPATALPQHLDDGVAAARGDKGKKDKGKPAAAPAEAATPAPPPPDSDGDGVPDADDKCLDSKEDRDGHEDGDGCPDPDNDGDGVPDATDKCPMEAENLDGWDDTDGCPEAPPKLSPFLIDAELNDGTKFKGKVLRIVAVDEDDAAAGGTEPGEVDVIVDEVHEFQTPWSNVKSLKGEKVVFTDAVDCYSEGVEDLGDASTWECTLKVPLTVTLAASEKKGTHRLIDRKMRRLDWKIEVSECTGTSCPNLQSSRTLPIYVYKLVAFEKNEDEPSAVASLQNKLRELLKTQIKSATLSPLK